VSLWERAGLAVLHRFDPERAHGLSLLALRLGLASLPGVVTSPRLATTLAGLTLPNPIGLAAGYDKNAVAIAPLSRAGFGFLEVGAATPLPQDGNPKPRLYRLAPDRAAINRFGFNNEGADAICTRLKARTPGAVPVGLNLGANKTSPDRAADFARVLSISQRSMSAAPTPKSCAICRGQRPLPPCCPASWPCKTASPFS
jgi:dihydroorotate dehydrogenase